MLQRDYILRMIEQLVQALGRITKLRARGADDEAQHELQQLGESAFGVSLDLLVAMSIDDLTRLQSTGGQPDFDRLALLARFFKERGQNEPDAAMGRRFRHQALRLWHEVLTRGPANAMALHRQALAELQQSLAPEELAAEVREDLWRTFELSGSFADAENQLEELRDLDPERYLPAGVPFYERLLAHSDQELAAGNLPRDEVEEGLARWQRLALMSRSV